MTERDDIHSPDGNGSTLNLQVFVCSVCGDDHETIDCGIVLSLTLVNDSKILSRARQTLPKNLDVKTLADGSTTVITNVRIEQGTQFGPFQAPLSLDLPPTVLFPLKVFGKTLDEGYFLDTTHEESCNWMCLVATATNTREQNLICYDVKQSIFFATTRDILPGEELRLWYALYYGLKLQALPLADDSTQEEGFYDLVDEEVEGRFKSNEGTSAVLGEDLLQTLTQHLPAHSLGASGERDVWICKLCGVQETNVASYARHLMIHYRQPVHDNRHPQCKVCLKRFFSKKVLEKHISRLHKNQLEQNETSCTSVSHETLQSDDLEHSPCPRQKVACLQDELKVHSQKGALPTNSSFICMEANKLEEHLSELESPTNLLEDREENYESDISPSNRAKDFKGTDAEDQSAALNSISDSADEKEVVGKHEKMGKTSQNLVKFSDCNEAGSTPPLCHSSPLNVTDDQMNQFAKKGKFHISELHKKGNEDKNNQVEVTNREQVLIHSSNGENFSTSFEVSGAQDINVALENGESITFIMVQSTDEENIPDPSADGDITANRNSLAHSSISDTSPLDQSFEVEDSASIVISSHTPNPELLDKKTLPFKCDICQKSFGKCSYLYRHLRKHTGEFTCISCLAVFARKENLKAHSCSQPKVWFPCPTCGKKFSAKKYLQRHIPIHTGEFSCSSCTRHFVSRLSLKCHRCCGGKHTSTDNSAASCFMCERVFSSESKLKTHLKVHSDINSETSKMNSTKSGVNSTKKAPRSAKSKEEKHDLRQRKASEGKLFICEICGAIFKSSSSMKTHRHRHGERKFECDVCKKRFHRKDVLQEHLRVHQNANFPCELCGKKYKTKKSLYVHSLIHEGSKQYSCGICGKEFFQKGNLIKHAQTHVSERMYPCHYCDKSFSSKEYFNIHQLTHTQGKIHRCADCNRGFVKKHLLDTHRQSFHSNRGYLCKFCNTVVRYRHSIRRHLEKSHSGLRQEWSVPRFIDQLLTNLPSNLLNPTGDAKLTPKQQQERQQQLESLRNRHFHSKKTNTTTVSDDSGSLSEITYPFLPTTGPQINHLTQGDPLITLQSTEQLILTDNFLPQNVQGSEGEILYTLVDQDAVNDSSLRSTTPFLTSSATESSLIGMDTGTTYMMEDVNGCNSVLLYVVETSNGEEGDSQDLVWCSDSVGQQL